MALTGTNPRPLLLSGTEELVGKQVDDSVQANYRRQVATVTAQPLVKELAAL